MALNSDNIATTTLQLIRKRLADAVFKANPTSAWFLMNGRVETASGGKRIDEPLIYATNNTVKAYTGYDRLNVSPTEELTQAQFAWKQFAGSVSMSGLEELENAGESAVFNLLQTKIKILEMSMKQWFAEKMCAKTATKDSTKDFLGLDEIIERLAGASQGTVGGILKATSGGYTWWQNQYKAGSSLSTSTTALTNDMNNFYHTCTKGLTKPDLILTDQFLFERYENDNRDKLRLTDTRLMEVGFDNLKFKGATMMWDENVMSSPGGDATHHLMYFINSQFMRIVLHARRNFVMTPFVTPYDQDAKVAQMLVAGNMTVSNERFQGVYEADE